MASTYTTNLRLTKQGDGENPNSWGQILNDGVISLADSAIAGYTTVSIGSAATVTLTENQGSNDQARSAFLEFKGSIGGAYTSIFVLIPNNSKGYVVRNSVSYTSADNAVILRVAGNDGVTIASGSNKFVITDGTSVYNVTNDTFSNITVEGNADIQGTLSVSGAATFKSTVTVEGAAVVSGAASFLSGVSVSGALIAKGTNTFAGANTFSNTVTVAGVAGFKSHVNVSGNMSVGGTTSITGAALFASTVTVVGAGTFKSNVSVSGNMNIAGNTSIGGTVTIVGANVQAANAKVCASAFYGDATNMTGLLPSGVILPYGASASPTGFLLCNGQAVNRSTYSSLFAIVSSLYGNGDGSSTFNVPDLRGRFVAGWDAGTSVLTSVTANMVLGSSIANTGGAQAVTLTTAQMPAHTHSYTIKASGVGGNEGSGSLWYNTSSSSTGSTGSDGAHSNIPPTMILNYIIKT
jgi:microcystin-dependent protein